MRDAGESLEEAAEWVTGDGIDDEDTSEDEIKNTSEAEPGLRDASEDAHDDMDIGEDQIKNIMGKGVGVKGASEDALADEDSGGNRGQMGNQERCG